MALRHGYVRTWPSHVDQLNFLDSRVHGRLSCARIRDRNAMVIVQVDNEDTATWRHTTRKVQWCPACRLSLDWEWQDQAECKSTYPPVDMIDVGRGGAPAAARLIAQYCQPCRVRSECAAFALSERDTVGIWGGVLITGRRNHAQEIEALKAACDILPKGDAA